jgi:osmotically inducible lipoprotein OsmB
VLGSAVGGTAATIGGAAVGGLIGNEVGKRKD